MSPARFCPVCETPTGARPFGEKGGFVYWRCLDCDCRFAGRLADDGELERLYEQYYPEAGQELPSFLGARLAEIVAGFAPYRRTGKLLDVGYGAGALLSAADAAGWDCWGTELSPVAIEAGRKRGWTVVPGDLCAADVPAGEFDVVCLVEVLEHLVEPLTYLRRCRELLRPGGLLYATSPNGSGINSRILGTEWSIYSAPEHMQLFTPRSAALALRRSGFRRCTLRTEGLNPSELRARIRRSAPEAPAGRVEAGYALNQRLSSGRGRHVKRLANSILTCTRTGDTLKIHARK